MELVWKTKKLHYKEAFHHTYSTYIEVSNQATRDHKPINIAQDCIKSPQNQERKLDKNLKLLQKYVLLGIC